MAEKNKVLGLGACPLCAYPEQEIRESAKGKPYLTCDECGVQLFARQARSVRILLDKIGRPPSSIPKPATPAAAPLLAAKPTPAPVAAPVARPEGKTIFDIFN